MTVPAGLLDQTMRPPPPEPDVHMPLARPPDLRIVSPPTPPAPYQSHSPVRTPIVTFPHSPGTTVALPRVPRYFERPNPHIRLAHPQLGQPLPASSTPRGSARFPFPPLNVSRIYPEDRILSPRGG